MQRNDLTSEEMRFKRLLRSLDRGPAAPDADFLRRLQETSTAAFVAAQTARPRAQRVVNAPPLDPTSGRRRMRVVRVAIFSSIAVLLVIGLFPSALFPARGVELQVALNNLALADFAEIEIQNGAGSNTLLFARSDDAAPRWRVDYASGNAEVSDGAATYFLNRGHNSIHPSPLEEANAAPTFVEDKLLASLNLSDRAVKSSLMQQRPETAVDHNGQRLYQYNFQVADRRNVGETLTVNATVNAETNTLVTINSEVRDAAGHSKFRANADVKSLNAVIPSDRFQVDPQAEPSEQIAMVEDVQGLAVLDDLTPLPGVESAPETEVEVFTMQRARNGAASQYAPFPGDPSADRETAVTLQMPMAGAAAMSAPMLSEGSLKKTENAPRMAMSAIGEKRSAKALTQSPNVEMAMNSAGVTGSALPSSVGPGKSGDSARPRTNRMLKGKAPSPSAGISNTSDAAQSAEAQAGNPSRDSTLDNKDSVAAPVVAPVASPAPARGMAPANSVRRTAVAQAKAIQPEPSMKQQQLMGGGAAQPVAPPIDMPRGLQTKSFGPQGFGGAPRNFQMPQGQQLKIQNSFPGEAKNQIELQQSSRFNNRAGVQQNGAINLGVDYSFVRRQVAAQTELHPGGVLKTENDPANVVWVRLANDADLVLGPGSEVLLLKPTEVRLQAGELMLHVPAGDQVDLLGPDMAISTDIASNSSSVRRNAQIVNLNGSRLQVTGRGIYRIENSQLQRVDRDPAWLVNYSAKQSSPNQNSRSVIRQSPADRNAGEAADQKAPNSERLEPK